MSFSDYARCDHCGEAIFYAADLDLGGASITVLCGECMKTHYTSIVERRTQQK